MYANFVIHRYLSKNAFHYLHQFQQSIPSYISNIPLGVRDSANLKTKFIEKGINVKSGRHSIYIHNIKDIARINREISHRYPRPFGLKIVKSREVSPDGTVYYTSNKLAAASTWFSMVAVGSMLEKIVISNLLHTEWVAPLIYDIIKLKSGDGGWQYAFVVQHIDGHIVTGIEGEHFISDFRKAMNKFSMKVISIKEHSDLRPPQFRNNIVSDTTQTVYVDIQNFVMFDDTFTKDVLQSMTPLFKNSYYSLPACLLGSKTHQEIRQYRKTNFLLKKFFQKNGVDLSDNIIIDISDDNGFFAINCLHLGARWVLLFREKKVCKCLYFMMTLLGFSRFKINDSVNALLRSIGEKKTPDMTYLSIKGPDLMNNLLLRIESKTVIIESNNDILEIMLKRNHSFKKRYAFVDQIRMRREKDHFLSWTLFKIISNI